MKMQRSLLLVFLLCGIYEVVSQYPMCTDLDNNWVYEGDFGNGVAVDECKGVCRTTHILTFCGVKRNGPQASLSKCYCIETPPETSVGGCGYTCGGQPCGGGNGKYSVYPVCIEGKYGPSCGTDCPGSCADGVCDLITGDCPAGCANGRHGAACDQLCGQCANGVCDQDDAVCEGGCHDGWFTPTCTTECSGSCANGACDRDTGDCPTGCADGFHGAACDQPCGKCINVICDQVDALCDGGCTDGWYTPTCTSECPENCLSATCNIHNATCFHGCQDGYYSVNCTEICPDKCANNQCNRETGDCGDGCKDGWYTAKCTEQCSDTCGGASQKCGQIDGTCSEGCVDGWYEPRCTARCSEQCAGSSKVCEQFDGTCIEGCIDGWYGLQCSQLCSVNCAGLPKTCYQHNGTCTQGCINGWYTPQCTDQCSLYCNATSCGLYDGTCLYGCTSGHYGSTCETPCPTQCSEAGCRRDSGYCYSCYPGYHDTLCNGTCSQNCASGVCNRTDGACTEGCQCGWSGVYCDTGAKCDGLSTGAIIGICVSVVVAITGVILLILFFVCRNKNAPKTSTGGSMNPGLDNTNGYVNVGDPEFSDPGQSKAQSISNISLTSEHTVDIGNFQEYVRAMLDSQHMMSKEYGELPQDDVRVWDQALRPEVKNKNKFKGIYPYDHNRVVLGTIKDDPAADYINASRIQGYHPDDKFIAALGPRVRTLFDFWRMIWQEKVSTIVMLTNLVEAGLEKCTRYWPDQTPQNYGDLTVVGDLEESWPSYVIRQFVVQKGAASRTVTQYHFTQWPDHGVPSDATSLLEFRRKFSKSIKHDTPVVVHCSAGVGRTGTLIALDYLIKQAESEDKLSVYNCVHKLRHQRMRMVQTEEQYIFLHDALSQYFRVGQTTAVVSEFSDYYHQLINGHDETSLLAQYRALEQLAPEIPDYDKEYALSPENQDKNRYAHIIPMMACRVFLKSRLQKRNDYINAVSAIGHRTKDAYHVTQFPLEHTVVDFWRMVQDYNSKILVVLGTKQQAKEMTLLLPAKNRPMDILDNVACVRSSMTTGSYRVIDLNIGGTTEDDNQYMNMEEVSKHSGVDIRVYEIRVPQDQECLDYTAILDVYKDLRGKGDGKPIAVLCLNGATYSGQFVACCNLFEMIESEQKIDVFQVSKYIRDSRPEFIGSLEQYRGLHDAANLFVAQHGVYANC